jgi:hypothetical protein
MATAAEDIQGERFWSDPEAGRFATLLNVAGSTDFVQVLVWRPSMSMPGKFDVAGVYAVPGNILSSLALHLVKKAGELAASKT